MRALALVANRRLEIADTPMRGENGKIVVGF